MSQINLNVQGIDSAASIEIITKALGPLGDVKNIHVDWESEWKQDKEIVLKRCKEFLLG